jgi:hypothetical protein
MEFESRKRSHSLENLFWKTLWTCCKTLCSSNKLLKQITRQNIKLRWVFNANAVLLHHFSALEGSGLSEISVTFYQISKVSHPRRQNSQVTAVKTSKPHCNRELQDTNRER